MDSRTVSFIFDIAGLAGDLCMLFITAFTLYLTVFSRKMTMFSPGFSYSMFYGNTMTLYLKNHTLHSLPVTKVFWMKRIEGSFHCIVVADYREPLILDSWHIAKITSDPYTEIIGLDETESLHMDAVVGVDIGGKHIWAKPYRKAPLRAAKKAFKKHEFDNLTVSAYDYGGRVLSKGVRYAVDVRTTDLNGNHRIKTFFVKAGEDGGTFSESIRGCSGIGGEACRSAGALKKYLCGSFGIKPEDIVVTELRGYEAKPGE